MGLDLRACASARRALPARAASTRHALDWKNPEFRDHAALARELERVFDICHGCRRCFSLCNSFPVLFDHVDHCYLCDMCYMSKCLYVPPNPWNVDFLHLMLRAKAVRLEGEARHSVIACFLRRTSWGGSREFRSCEKS